MSPGQIGGRGQAPPTRQGRPPGPTAGGDKPRPYNAAYHAELDMPPTRQGRPLGPPAGGDKPRPYSAAYHAELDMPPTR